MKLCIKCNQTKKYSEFYKKTSAKDGHSSYCRQCYKDYDQSDKAKTIRRSYLLSKKGNSHVLKQINSVICWQKLQRDKLLQEDISLGMPLNVPAGEFVLAYEKLNKEHREFITRYEWLGTIGFGVRHVFTARYNGALGGVVMVAEPNAYQFDKNREALIQRGACASWTPKNLGSRLVMFACNWMVRNTSKRIFTAYSDPEANEVGTIYQACNFDYLGQTFGSKKMLMLNGKKVGARIFTRTSSMKKWAKELGIKWMPDWTKPNGFQNIKAIPDEIRSKLMSHAKAKMSECKQVTSKPKGKYVLLINYGKDKVQKTWQSKPYPKRSER